MGDRVSQARTQHQQKQRDSRTSYQERLRRKLNKKKQQRQKRQKQEDEVVDHGSTIQAAVDASAAQRFKVDKRLAVGDECADMFAPILVDMSGTTSRNNFQFYEYGLYHRESDDTIGTSRTILAGYVVQLMRSGAMYENMLCRHKGESVNSRLLISPTGHVVWILMSDSYVSFYIFNDQLEVVHAAVGWYRPTNVNLLDANKFAYDGNSQCVFVLQDHSLVFADLGYEMRDADVQRRPEACRVQQQDNHGFSLAKPMPGTTDIVCTAVQQHGVGVLIIARIYMGFLEWRVVCIDQSVGESWKRIDGPKFKQLHVACGGTELHTIALNPNHIIVFIVQPVKKPVYVADMESAKKAMTLKSTTTATTTILNDMVAAHILDHPRQRKLCPSKLQYVGIDGEIGFDDVVRAMENVAKHQNVEDHPTTDETVADCGVYDATTDSSENESDDEALEDAIAQVMSKLNISDASSSSDSDSDSDSSSSSSSSTIASTDSNSDDVGDNPQSAESEPCCNVVINVTVDDQPEAETTPSTTPSATPSVGPNWDLLVDHGYQERILSPTEKACLTWSLSAKPGVPPKLLTDELLIIEKMDDDDLDPDHWALGVGQTYTPSELKDVGVPMQMVACSVPNTVLYLFDVPKPHGQKKKQRKKAKKKPSPPSTPEDRLAQLTVILTDCSDDRDMRALPMVKQTLQPMSLLGIGMEPNTTVRPKRFWLGCHIESRAVYEELNGLQTDFDANFKVWSMCPHWTSMSNHEKLTQQQRKFIANTPWISFAPPSISVTQGYMCGEYHRRFLQFEGAAKHTQRKVEKLDKENTSLGARLNEEKLRVIEHLTTISDLTQELKGLQGVQKHLLVQQNEAERLTARLAEMKAQVAETQHAHQESNAKLTAQCNDLIELNGTVTQNMENALKLAQESKTERDEWRDKYNDLKQQHARDQSANAAELQEAWNTVEEQKQKIKMLEDAQVANKTPTTTPAATQ